MDATEEARHRMIKTDASTNPVEPGYYACWLHLSDRPVVLYWGEQSTDWRYGAMKMNVTHWLALPK